MANILIWMNYKKNVEFDIFTATDYNVLKKRIRNEYNGVYPNVGNKLWVQAIVSELSTNENRLSFLEDEPNYDIINSCYDMVVAPMANIFNPGFKDMIIRLTSSFNRIKIPIYVIACGVQADTYDELNSLCDKIGDISSAFITSVYQTGGEFALRGFFSKSFFDRLGFHSAIVTGCPSLYQLGRVSPIRGITKKTEIIKPLFNGDLNKLVPLLKKYPDSLFFDQDQYFSLLYDNYQVSIKTVTDLVNRYGLEELKYIAEKKVRLICDTSEWFSFIQKQEFNFSFGERIHGNILPILAGVPSVVHSVDARTREIAEFFDIPYITNKSAKDIENIYYQMDYSKFNKHFSERYDAFETFLINHNIVSKINTNNMFFELSTSNHENMMSNIELREISELLNKYSSRFKLLDKKNKIRRVLSAKYHQFTKGM